MQKYDVYSENKYPDKSSPPTQIKLQTKLVINNFIANC